MLADGIIAGCWIVFIVYWAVSARNVKRNVYEQARWRRLLGPSILVLAVLASGVPAFRGTFIPQGPATGAIAVLLCASGVAFAIWARRRLGRNWSGQPSLKEDHELVASGPYRFVRHPIYTGILTAMFGTALINDALWLVAAGLFCVLFISRAREEERLMLRQFPGEYPAYRRRTRMLIPLLL